MDVGIMPRDWLKDKGEGVGVEGIKGDVRRMFELFWKSCLHYSEALYLCTVDAEP